MYDKGGSNDRLVGESCLWTKGGSNGKDVWDVGIVRRFQEHVQAKIPVPYESGVATCKLEARPRGATDTCG